MIETVIYYIIIIIVSILEMEIIMDSFKGYKKEPIKSSKSYQSF